MASTLAGLAQYHDWVSTVVTDDVLEDIRYISKNFKQNKISLCTNIYYFFMKTFSLKNVWKLTRIIYSDPNPYC